MVSLAQGNTLGMYGHFTKRPVRTKVKSVKIYALDNATNSIKFKYKYSSHHLPITIDYGKNIFDDPFHRTFD